MDQNITDCTVSPQSRGASCVKSFVGADSVLRLIEDTNSLTIACLPEISLVKVMEYLNLKERYNLSMTCHIFHNLFRHPQLWQTARIVLFPVEASGSKNHMKWKLKSVMHQTMAEIVKRFSYLFQHLSLEMNDYVQRFDEYCLQLLHDLNAECRLESLTLKLGPIASSDERINRVASLYSNTQDIHHVTSLIRNAVRLKHLNILTWPLMKGHEMDESDGLFQAMMKNEKLCSLKSLSLFYLSKEDGHWAERIPKLPSPQTTLQVVTRFNNLSHLALRSPMLSNELILELVSRKNRKLKLMQILVVYSREIKIPNISSQVWSKIKTSNPELEVECVILTRIPTEQLAFMLKPEIPLSAMSVLLYGSCDSSLIEALAFKKSLRKFESLCDSNNCDAALLQLAKTCPQLNHLSFHGDIAFTTVIKIAELLKTRGVKWRSFQFKEDNIKTMDTDNEVDEDIVVARNTDNQELYLVGVHRWHNYGDVHRRKRLDHLTAKVSGIIGCSWCPV